jgi:hypothetical protein
MPVRLRAAMLRTFCVWALAAGATGCVNTAGPPGRGHVVLGTDAAAVLNGLEREMAASLANGHAYSLTQIEGMTAAHGRGAEGDDAAALWDAEIQRHYRSRRFAMARALRAEVETYDDATLAHIVAEARDERLRQAHGFFNSQTYRRAAIDSLCAAMASTPRAWARLYPRRAPFSFPRFGIDEARIMGWCAARDRP